MLRLEAAARSSLFTSPLGGREDQLLYRYFSFQVWQEGVARYTEYRMGRLVAEQYIPTGEFRALSDYTSFAVAADEVRRSILDGLRPANLGQQPRAAFYPVGAATALLMNEAAPL